MAATDFFLFPVLPQTSSAGAAGVALHLLVYVSACAGVDVEGGVREGVPACICVWSMCLSVSERGLLPVARA